MPDVTRSDSQRSDASLRPRVSFNRDVHVKRIVPREGNRVLGALSGDGEGHLVTSPVRKERLSRSKEQLAKEAAEVLQQADKLDCVIKDSGAHPNKFYTLPTRKKRHPEYSQTSLDRRTRRKDSEEFAELPPKKPPRTFAAHRESKTPPRTSVFNIFKGNNEPKKSNLRRSVSDASNSRSKTDDAQFRKRSGSETEEANVKGGGKKQLSPIIEVAQREDYFTPNNNNKNNKTNTTKTNTNEHVEPRELSVTEKLKEYIDEIDTELYKESGVRVNPPVKKPPEIVIIDVDEADQISSSKKTGKKSKGLGKKLIKSLAAKSKSSSSSSKTKDNYVKPEGGDQNESKKAKMIHSSQKPAEKLPLTRGRAVDNMVKRLSHDSSSPPPKTSIMITPNVTVQHNNNQPFSYTRGQSPEKTFSDEPRSPTKPIIYAQVVCGGNKNNPAGKQTVHTTYVNGKKNVPHSDSDEGLGYEENSGCFGHREKTVTHFGDEHFEKNIIINYNDHHDRFEEEFPITPKFKTTTYNGFGSYNDSFNHKTEQTLFIDSSNRGRGDGMDAKRRESLTEPEQGLFAKYNGGSPNNVHANINNNGRSDLSARRDLLESRITRRLGEKTLRPSPEYSPRPANYNNVYVTTETSRYYRSGSASPIGFRDKYTEEVVVDKVGGERYKTESRTRKYFGEDRHNNRYNNFDSEPKSFDSQISDYRSSPEATSHNNYKSSHQDKYVSKTVRQQIHKDRDLYKSNPEINQKNYHHERYPESYHDSLKRVSSSKYRDEQYFDQTDSERKDKFGDSGIENDFRRDSGENFKKREVFNESEDEGFASSLLIASERQHTEDNFATRKRSNRSNQRDSRERDDPYRNVESMEIKYRKDHRNEYAPRERSIDDGSHFDPRIDKDVTLKKGTDKKPPKPEKKSGLEKMKQLFSRDSKKKKEKERGMVREESLRARYTEYRGSREELGPKAKKKDVGELNSSFDYSNRRRLSTPSPSPPRQQPHQNEKPENTHGSWFKSLDRLARKKSKKEEKEFEEATSTPLKQPPQKNLRFFGDTDIESNDSLRKPSMKIRPTLTGNARERTRSQSTRDLHNISEERGASPEMHRANHKSMLNISESSDRDLKGSRLSLKPPMSPSHRHREVSRSKDDRNRRRKNEVSSVESSTEGDSSQQSQRSVVYLHAATVGDIPGPGYLRGGRRAASREELASSNGSNRVQPQTKTLSRSFSVLAPWRPKHNRETMDIDYTQYPKPVKNGKYEQKTPKNGSSRKENSSTLKKKAQETKRNNQSASTLNRKSRSKENVSTLKRSKEETPKSASSTLYKKKERQPKENTRYNSNKEEKKFSAKTLSMESLGGNSRTSRRSREESREVSRSISMPRDPEKSAGWFKMSKKSKKSDSTQRL